MRKLSADDFLRITAQLSVSNDKVRTICEDSSYLTILGLFTAKWCKNIFSPSPLNEVVPVSEELFDEAWHNAMIDVIPIIKAVRLDTKTIAKMFSEYIGDVFGHLFINNFDIRNVNKLYGCYKDIDPTDEDDYNDYEDDVDETFYNPYTGCDF